MSEDTLERIEDLVDEAMQLPHGEVQVRLLDEAVRLADIVRDQDVMFATRIYLVDSGVFSGHFEKSLPAFAWCLAQFEQDPQRYRDQERTLLWYFKNVLHNADELPQLTREQVEELRGQMARLYGQCGYNMRPVHYTRLVFAIRIGDRQLAEESFANYRAVRRDSMADCIACEADSEVEYFEFIDEPEQALKTAGPSLQGRLTCAEVPHRTYSYVLRPLAVLGRYEEADEYHRKGYRLIRNNPAFLRHVAWHMAFLMHRGKQSSAVRMLERHLSWAIDTFHLGARYLFYVSSRRTLAWLAENSDTAKLDLPKSFPAYRPSGDYDLAELIAWFDSQLAELGARFDARNQNDFFTRNLVERLQY
ncbi:hypothetical protein NG895_01420 [Aeoliella sp. ICT_H6.2]|uniref:Uncharacterized protein n=1 Tax=Aeoliella straminimaris TaxID=2954799 RepID=A0A9X2FEC0_9BACT|nr:hypothetical protein [Aeoliella straminimaris]MCO6042556.1 hypothetical protein [Aeoliella straminimaris]